MIKSLRFIFIMAIISCSQPDPPQANDKEKEDKSHFPVHDYLKSEIRNVEALQVNLLKTTTERNSTDSAYINPDEFKRTAEIFLHPDLQTDHFSTMYEETSFYDRTTQSSVFTYAPKKGDLSVQRVDVVVKTGEGYDKVNNIYIETRPDDSGYSQKLFWKPGSHFLIITESDASKQPEPARQVKVDWNLWVN